MRGRTVKTVTWKVDFVDVQPFNRGEYLRGVLEVASWVFDCLWRWVGAKWGLR